MESYLDHGHRAYSGPETPKLRSASSPDVRAGSIIPSPASYSFPREPSHIFYTPPIPSSSALYLDTSRPRASTLHHSYPTPPDSNPVRALAARTTPFYLGGVYQEIPTRLTGEGRAASLWTGSESATGWTPSASYKDSGAGSASSGGEHKMDGIELGLSHLSRSSVDVTTRLGVLTDLVQKLADRVLTLEQVNGGQAHEIVYLRHLVEASLSQPLTSTPPHSQSYSTPYQGPLPPSFFPSTSSAQRPSTPPNKSAHHDRSLSSSQHFGHSQSATTSSDVSYASQSSAFDSSTFDSPSPGSPKQLRRRSRGSESGTQPRLRGASFSAIAPVVAQAKWMSQQSPKGGSPEQLTYRSLLLQDADIDPEIFISRILAHNDQQCSIYLQQRIKIASAEERRVPVYTAVGAYLLELSFNKFGNFLVSRCLEYGGTDLVFSYLEVMKGSFLELSMDAFGCHVVQKMLDCGDQNTKAAVIEEIIDHPSTLTHKSSGHVWNKILAPPNSPSLYLRISRTGSSLWAEIAKNESGSLIVQSVLENWGGAASSVIAKELLEKVGDVAVTQWGSFVVLHLIEHCAPTFLHAILESATTLSLDNFGAKAIEKSLKSEHFPSTFMGPFIDAICNASEDRRPPIVDIASHASGAQLLTLLFTGSLTTPEEKAKLVQTVKKHGVTLKASKEGAKIWFLCERTRSYNGASS